LSSWHSSARKKLFRKQRAAFLLTVRGNFLLKRDAERVARWPSITPPLLSHASSADCAASLFSSRTKEGDVLVVQGCELWEFFGGQKIIFAAANFFANRRSGESKERFY
jgi:hypothetical protein